MIVKWSIAYGDMMFFASLKMMLLHFVPQWCDVCSMCRQAHIISISVIIGEANIICRRQTSFKNAPLSVDKSAFFVGGADGNWTRVQRSIHTTFSVDSQSFRFPTSGRRVTGSHQGSFLMHDRYKSNSRFTCTTDLTHGLGRSPPKRYGRQY